MYSDSSVTSDKPGRMALTTPTYVDSDVLSLSAANTDCTDAEQNGQLTAAIRGSGQCASDFDASVMAESGAWHAVIEGVSSWAQFRGGKDQIGLEHFHPELRDAILQRGLKWTWGGSEFEKLKRENNFKRLEKSPIRT